MRSSEALMSPPEALGLLAPSEMRARSRISPTLSNAKMELTVLTFVQCLCILHGQLMCQWDVLDCRCIVLCYGPEEVLAKLEMLEPS